MQSGEAKADLAVPVTWANENKKPFDVFIIMTDFRHPKAFTDLSKCFKEYRDQQNLPKAK